MGMLKAIARLPKLIERANGLNFIIVILRGADWVCYLIYIVAGELEHGSDSLVI